MPRAGSFTLSCVQSAYLLFSVPPPFQNRFPMCPRCGVRMPRTPQSSTGCSQEARWPLFQPDTQLTPLLTLSALWDQPGPVCVHTVYGTPDCMLCVCQTVCVSVCVRICVCVCADCVMYIHSNHSSGSLTLCVPNEPK